MSKKPYVSKNIKKEKKQVKKDKKTFTKFSAQIIISILFFTSPIFSVENLSKEDIDTINTSCKAYIDKNRTADVEKFRKYIESRIKQKIEDDPSTDEENALKSITLDWLADNQSKIEQHDKFTLLRASILFTIYIEKRIMFPQYIIDKIIENRYAINNFFEY